MPETITLIALFIVVFCLSVICVVTAYNVVVDVPDETDTEGYITTPPTPESSRSGTSSNLISSISDEMFEDGWSSEENVDADTPRPAPRRSGGSESVASFATALTRQVLHVVEDPFADPRDSGEEQGAPIAVMKNTVSIVTPMRIRHDSALASSSGFCEEHRSNLRLRRPTPAPSPLELSGRTDTDSNAEDTLSGDSMIATSGSAQDQPSGQQQQIPCQRPPAPRSLSLTKLKNALLRRQAEIHMEEISAHLFHLHKASKTARPYPHTSFSTPLSQNLAGQATARRIWSRRHYNPTNNNNPPSPSPSPFTCYRIHPHHRILVQDILTDWTSHALPPPYFLTLTCATFQPGEITLSHLKRAGLPTLPTNRNRPTHLRFEGHLLTILTYDCSASNGLVAQQHKARAPALAPGECTPSPRRSRSRSRFRAKQKHKQKQMFDGTSILVPAIYAAELEMACLVDNGFATAVLRAEDVPTRTLDILREEAQFSAAQHAAAPSMVLVSALDREQAHVYNAWILLLSPSLTSAHVAQSNARALLDDADFLARMQGTCVEPGNTVLCRGVRGFVQDCWEAEVAGALDEVRAGVVGMGREETGVGGELKVLAVGECGKKRGKGWGGEGPLPRLGGVLGGR